jgi:hypothetical protein
MHHRIVGGVRNNKLYLEGWKKSPTFTRYDTDRIVNYPTTCSRYSGNVFAGLLPSNDEGIYIYEQTRRLVR